VKQGVVGGSGLVFEVVLDEADVAADFDVGDGVGARVFVDGAALDA